MILPPTSETSYHHKVTNITVTTTSFTKLERPAQSYSIEIMYIFKVLILYTQIQFPIQNFKVMFKCNRNYRDVLTFTFQMVILIGIRDSLAPDLSFKYLEALKLSLKVSQSLFDSRRFGLGSLLFFLFCFSVLVFGSDRKRKKVCDKTNAPWDTEWDLRSSHWPNHLLKTPSLPFLPIYFVG